MKNNSEKNNEKIDRVKNIVKNIEIVEKDSGKNRLWKIYFGKNRDNGKKRYWKNTEITKQI